MMGDVTMSKMISVASGFQYSVNIGYDLNNDNKLKNFIPTKSALALLEEILMSTSDSSTERSRILIGAYGKGKSHIMLMILSVLLKKDLSLFEKTLPKIAENPKLQQLVENYYEGKNRILPVVITGSNTSLSQAFMLALQRTLSDNDLLDIMPETNYRAVVSVIERWKSEFPETYVQFQKNIDVPVNDFITAIENFDIGAYEQFERIFPTLTSGSVFNPFLGFDVVELYESVAKELKAKGFTGIYVVYDEFSKYLEANITEASVSDTKMLQDFAEKCNRSASVQLHLMLISHKEIANYIDKLPKQKVDGWRGVSERFKHIHLNNNFSQTYEIISSVIQKDSSWAAFTSKHEDDFAGVEQRYKTHPLFSESIDELHTALYGCYPLHPVSTFILPRLSERVAQNERTLFTFLSAPNNATLPAYLEQVSDDEFAFITPDVIYDYFEPLFKKEAYSGEIRSYYILTSAITTRLVKGSLESKIVKTLSLIYILGQFERLKPTKDEIVGIYSTAYSVQAITEAIDNLIEREYVVYLKRSNDYLKLKQTSGVDIKQKIHDYSVSHAKKIAVKETLNASNFDNYMYPSRYNDEREMTRYFAFVFIDEDEVEDNTNWIIKSERIGADGVIFAVIPHSEDSIPVLKKSLEKTSKDCRQQIFILPKHYQEISDVVHEYEAVSFLRESASDDAVLFDEYDVIYEDLRDVISGFMATYTHPETYKAHYIHDGQVCNIKRKAALTELMANICNEVYSLTPIINNEAVNRDDITNVASNSRSKIVAALLRNQLEVGLGLTGTGQEVSIMRSTLIRTGILREENGLPSIDLRPSDHNIANMLETIENFILSSRHNERISFEDLYDTLRLPEYHIGLRKGLIPIYLAAVIHEYKQQIVILDKFSQVPTTADALLQINSDPAAFSLSYLDWNPQKEAFVGQLAAMFADFVIEAEKGANTYDYVVNAMKRWLLSLPKYAKESRVYPNGKRIDERYLSMNKLLRQNTSSYELLFESLPNAFGYRGEFTAGLAENIKACKECYDNLIEDLKEALVSKTKVTFMLPANEGQGKNMSLASTIREWCDTLDPACFTHLFSDGTDKCLALFKSITNDENAFIMRLAKTAIGLRIEDWDSSTIDTFEKKLTQYKATAESYHTETTRQDTEQASNYQVTFIDADGGSITKSFERVESTKRGKLLYNQITQSLDAMGHSITEQEKRQILMDVLKKLC